MTTIDLTERPPRRVGRPGAGRPPAWSAERAFRGEERAWEGASYKAGRRRKHLRGWNPGGGESSDIHPMETRGFEDSEYVDRRGGIQLWRTPRGHYAVGQIGQARRWWVVPLADAVRGKRRRR